jgi:hypothetical protein
VLTRGRQRVVDCWPFQPAVQFDQGVAALPSVLSNPMYPFVVHLMKLPEGGDGLAWKLV